MIPLKNFQSESLFYRGTVVIIKHFSIEVKYALIETASKFYLLDLYDKIGSFISTTQPLEKGHVAITKENILKDAIEYCKIFENIKINEDIIFIDYLYKK